MVKTIYHIQHTKNNTSKKKKKKKEKKTLYKLMNNAVDEKTVENLGNRINIRLVKNEKDYLKWTSKPSYMSHKIFHNDLVTICKRNVTLTVNKPTYVGKCIFELSKELMCAFHFDHIKNKYDNNPRILSTCNESLMYENKTEDVYEDFSREKEMFDSLRTRIVID